MTAAARSWRELFEPLDGRRALLLLAFGALLVAFRQLLVVLVFFVVFQWLSELRLWKRREAGRPEDGVSNSKPTHHAHAEAEAVEVAR